MALAGVITTLLCLVSLTWAVVGFLKPTVLFFALPNFQTRKHAFFFPMSVALVLFFVLIAIADKLEHLSLILLPCFLFYIPSHYQAHLRGWKPKKVSVKKTPPYPENFMTAEMYKFLHEEEKTPKSEWMPDWKRTIKAFMGSEYRAADEEYFRDLFGGDNQCRFNLKMFMSRTKNGATCLHIPIDDYYRERFEVLVTTEAVQYGPKIPGTKRLTALKMEELRWLADALGVKAKQSKEATIEAIAEKGNKAIEEAWDATLVDEGDLFYADPDTI